MQLDCIPDAHYAGRQYGVFQYEVLTTDCGLVYRLYITCYMPYIIDDVLSVTYYTLHVMSDMILTTYDMLHIIRYILHDDIAYILYVMYVILGNISCVCHGM